MQPGLRQYFSCVGKRPCTVNSTQKNAAPTEVGAAVLVEAAGQLFPAFRQGLDYSFTCTRTCRGERVVGSVPTLVLHGQCPTGAYESLAGFSVSRSPDGVGLEAIFLSVHRMSSLFPTGITPRGDHFQSNPRPPILDPRVYMLMSSLIVGSRYPTTRDNDHVSSFALNGSARSGALPRVYESRYP